jgi:type IV secretory pathway VirB3-like protein
MAAVTVVVAVVVVVDAQVAAAKVAVVVLVVAVFLAKHEQHAIDHISTVIKRTRRTKAQQLSVRVTTLCWLGKRERHRMACTTHAASRDIARP